MILLIRGGSIAAGVGVKQSYFDILRNDKKFFHYEIINSSNPGDTTFDAIWTYRENIGRIKPDILILHFGLDDIYLSVYRSEFKENLVQIVRIAKNEFKPRILLTTSHTIDDAYEMDVFNIYYRTMREVAIDLECQLVPVHTCWASYLHEKGIPATHLLQKDYRYPNEEGHKIYANIMIKSLLKKKES